MRIFKRLNVVKQTDSEAKAEKYLEDGYKEIIEGKETTEEEVSDLESLNVKQLKEILDEQGAEYDAKAKKAELIELIEKGE